MPDNNLTLRGVSHTFQTPSLHPAEPLWKRAPTRDKNGLPLSDFMMLIPGLRDSEQIRLAEVINKIEVVLKQYEHLVVFADLNLKLNVLWVTVQPRLGICVEIASLIHHHVPEAKLVAQHHE